MSSSAPGSHPLPISLELNVGSDAFNNVFLQQGPGVQQRVLDQDDPIARRAAKSQVAVLGYGVGYAYSDWDTLCITYGDNRIPLRNHFGFNSCIAPDLKRLNRLSVVPVDIPGKGVGLRATRDIPRGEYFLLERPLLTCSVGTLTAAIVTNFDMLIGKSMTPEHQVAYYKLHNCKSKEAGMVESLSIMRTNGLESHWPSDLDDEPQHTVFDMLSRANHSCVPNADYDWNFKFFLGALRSIHPIKNGDEVTITYTARMCEPAAERKAELLRKYAFTCTCPVCDLPPEEQKRSDQRRTAIGNRHPLKTFDTTRLELGFDDAYIVETRRLCDIEGLAAERADVMVAYAEFEELRVLGGFTNDYSRAAELAKLAIEEIKKVGYHTRWEKMDQILKEKKKADART